MRTCAVVSSVVLMCLAGSARAQSTDPRINCWVFNLDGRHGVGGNSTVDARVNTILADTRSVRYDSTYVYMSAGGIPSYSIGPFTGNPNLPADQNYIMRIPRNPTNNTTHATVGLGNVGILINGVPIFNALDAMSYKNQNVWHQNAIFFEAASFDSALGHPQQQGAYHHHLKPSSLLAQLGDRSDVHSPLIGYAFDGYPIYGPYAYTNTDGTGAITRMRTSYRTRNITVRTTYASGQVVTAGPTVGTYSGNPNAASTVQPLGAYAEDFEYVSGLGDLDQYNGRFCKTPEFPGGTYCYFVTVDANGNGVYPYILGPTYYGVTVSQTGVTIPAGASTQTFGSSFPCATIWTHPQPVSAAVHGTASMGTKVRYGNGATYRWRKNTVPLSDSAGTIAGSGTQTLTLSGLISTDAGQYDCVVTTACGSIATNAATLTVVGACNVADITDGAGTGAPDGSLTGSDVVVFFQSFFAECSGAGAIPCNAADITDGAGTGSPDGSLTGSDVVRFFQSFFDACQ